MAAPGTTKTILRSLKHMNPPLKGSKFAIKAPSHAAHRPKFVQPKDRFPYWNIVPGDHVRLRNGRVGQTEGYEGEGDQKVKIRGEGIVLSIDREKNWIWLRDVDEKNKLAPKTLRHIVPRLVDPTDASKGYGPNVTEIPRPVHYSNVMLKIPGTDQYAVRLGRSKVRYDKQKGMFLWKRIATIKASEEKLKETGKAFERVEVPWPKLPGKRRALGTMHSTSNTVEAETWAPWRPEDPVFLPSPKQWTSVESEKRAEILLEERRKLDMLKKTEKAAPEGAQGTYAGFNESRAKPPPVAQPPTPAETLRAQQASTAEWSNAEAIRAHMAEGGLAFTASDYLDVAPKHGPAAGGDWAEPKHNPAAGLDGQRHPHNGRLANGVGKNDLDRMPIELLMQKDLTNPAGLKWRMRSWTQKQQVKKQEAADFARARQELLKELDSLKL